MERNLQKNGLVIMVVMLVATIVVYAVSRSSQLISGQISAGFMLLGFLAALVSWFQMRLEERERLERLELEELAKAAGSATLFAQAEADQFPARRSREQFEKYFVPGFSVLLGVLQGVGAWWCLNWLRRLDAQPLSQPLVALALLGIVALVLFLMGKYAAGLARLEKQPLLRPGTSYLLLGAYLLAFSAAAVVAYEAGYPRIDYFFAFALCALLALLAVETVIALLLEIYRPRVKGKVERVLYESRLVGLLSQPEGLFTTVAQALDYQFGFKVSETWFYQFLQRAFAWLVFAQLGLLLLSTCIVFIEPGEQALLERFGRPVAGRELLGPGPHLKLPWPIDKTYRYTNEAIQTFTIGSVHDDEGEEHGDEHGDDHGDDHGETKAKHGDVVLWTVSHTKEEFRLLVASRERLADGSQPGAEDRSPPVNLLAASIPVQFQITDLKAWAYNHQDAHKLLERIGTRETVRYMASADFYELTSTGRFAAAQELRNRIQRAADALNLGVKILLVGLADCHPPVQVARSYEQVAGSRQKREADLLAAEAHRVQTNALASAMAQRLKRNAEAASRRAEAGAQARAALFTNQIAAYRAAPSVYSTRAYLQLLARSGAGARKYVLTSTNTQDVLQLNLEDKIRADILDAAMPTMPSGKPSGHTDKH